MPVWAVTCIIFPRLTGLLLLTMSHERNKKQWGVGGKQGYSCFFQLFLRFVTSSSRDLLHPRGCVSTCWEPPLWSESFRHYSISCCSMQQRPYFSISLPYGYFYFKSHQNLFAWYPHNMPPLYWVHFGQKPICDLGSVRQPWCRCSTEVAPF